jgi:kynurenine formamidase
MDAVRRLGRELTNWGKWGADDERGTLNLITDSCVADAGRSIRTGQVFDLSLVIGPDLPEWPAANHRPRPRHEMTVIPADTMDGFIAADDAIDMPMQVATQWDGLAHVGYDGAFYNGVPAASVTAGGASRNSISATSPGAVGAAVLLDIAGLVGEPWLEGGRPITPSELDAAANRQGVAVGNGDIVLVRTGWRRKAVDEGWDGWLKEQPGLTLECARWLHEHGVSALACDNHAVEVIPTDHPEAQYPLHCVAIRDLGMPLGEMFDLEALSAACEADGQWRFFLAAPPLRVHGSVGAPTTPIAIR